MKYIIDHPSWQEACNGIACAFCTLADEKNGECRIRNYIQKQPKMPQWIPCSERLPEEKINHITHDFEEVLVTTIWGDVRHYKYGTPIGHDEAHFWNGFGTMDEEVVAWMPLPEPYREEASE